MKKIFFIFLTGTIVLNLTACAGGKDPRVCTGEHCFSVEIADTPSSRQQGLMNRDHLDQDKGMLFVFSHPARYGFWMKNTFVPLDIIWIDSNLNIVDITADAPPCVIEECPAFTPETEASYVLEINGGLCSRYGISVGDPVRIFASE